MKPVMAKFSFFVPSSLQTSKDVRPSALQHVLLDDVCLETESFTVQAHAEIAVSVLVLEHVHNDEENSIKLHFV